MRIIAVLGLTFFFLACESTVPRRGVKENYLSVDSIINTQIGVLLAKDVQLLKQVRIGDENEEQMIKFDSAYLAQELMVFRDLDLNVPSYVGSYEVNREGNSTTYSRKVGEKSPVEYVTIELNENGDIRQISGAFVDDKARSIYTVSRYYLMKFESGILEGYEIEGFQKMILQDTTRFSVVAQMIN